MYTHVVQSKKDCHDNDSLSGAMEHEGTLCGIKPEWRCKQQRKHPRAIWGRKRLWRWKSAWQSFRQRKWPWWGREGRSPRDLWLQAQKALQEIVTCAGQPSSESQVGLLPSHDVVSTLEYKLTYIIITILQAVSADILTSNSKIVRWRHLMDASDSWFSLVSSVLLGMTWKILRELLQQS